MCIPVKNSFPLTDTHYRLIAIKKITMGLLNPGLKIMKMFYRWVENETERRRERKREGGRGGETIRIKYGRGGGEGGERRV